MLPPDYLTLLYLTSTQVQRYWDDLERPRRPAPEIVRRPAVHPRLFRMPAPLRIGRRTTPGFGAVAESCLEC